MLSAHYDGYESSYTQQRKDMHGWGKVCYRQVCCRAVGGGGQGEVGAGRKKGAGGPVLRQAGGRQAR